MAAAAILLGAVAVLGAMAWSTGRNVDAEQEARRQDALGQQEAVSQRAIATGGRDGGGVPASQNASGEPVKLVSWQWPTPTWDPNPYTGQDTYDNPDVVTGKLQNVSSGRLSLVLVEFNLYDARDNRIGTAQTAVNGLEPGDVWKFEARVDDRRVKRVTVGSVSWL
jgi:type II secretory pathway pseudopilin PulG